MPSSIISPFPVFNDLDGSPLENGYIYIGQSNLNPETAPVNVFWDAARTIPAPQPIRTIGGFPSRNGSPSNVYVENDTYSITVRNSRRVFVYSAFDQSDAPSSVFDISTQVITATAGQTTFTLTTFTYLPGTDTLQVYRNGLRLTSVTDYIETNSSTVTLTPLAIAAAGDQFLFQGGAVITGNSTPGTSVSFIQAGTGAITRNMQDKVREMASVYDFGAVGNGSFYPPDPANWNDDTNAILLAVAYANSTGKSVHFPSGVYKCTQPIVLTQEAGMLVMDANSIIDFYLPNNYDIAISIEKCSQPFLSSIRSRNGKGVGIQIKDTLFKNVNIEKIQFFKGGIVLTSVSQFCYDNNVTFNTIDTTEFGIKLYCPSATHSLEGNSVIGNFLTTSPRPFWVVIEPGLLSPAGILWNYLEANVVHVTTPTSGAIYYDRELTQVANVGYNKIYVKTYFDTTNSSGTYMGPHIGGSQSGSGFVAGQEFDIAIYPGQTTVELAAFGGPRLTLRGISIYPADSATPLVCPLTANLALFNGGKATFSSAVNLRHQWTGAFGPGTIQTCYFYHVGGNRTTASSRKFNVVANTLDATKFKIDIFDLSTVQSGLFEVRVTTLYGASGPINVDFCAIMAP
jgi:hypothetical protein